MRANVFLLITMAMGLLVSGCVAQRGSQSEYARLKASSQVFAIQDLGYQQSQARGDTAVVIASIGVPYPAEAYTKRVGGAVKFKFTIATDGAANDIQIVEQPAIADFGKYALIALKKWRFRVSVKDGKVFPTPDMIYTVVFDSDKVERI